MLEPQYVSEASKTTICVGASSWVYKLEARRPLNIGTDIRETQQTSYNSSMSQVHCNARDLLTPRALIDA